MVAALSADTMSPHKILIITTLTPPPGFEVEAILGPCWGDSRNEAMNRLETHAMAIGGNAVFGLQFDSGELMQNTNEIVAYGTAVKLRKLS